MYHEHDVSTEVWTRGSLEDCWLEIDATGRGFGGAYPIKHHSAIKIVHHMSQPAYTTAAAAREQEVLDARITAVLALPQMLRALKDVVAAAQPIPVPMADGPDPFPVKYAPEIEQAIAAIEAATRRMA